MPGVDRSSLFSKWCLQHDLKVRTQRESTHFLLSGGIIRVPPELEDEALRVLGSDIAENKPNYVVERRTDVFRLCQDYDFVTTRENGIRNADFMKYLRVVQDVLVQVYPDLPPDKLIVVICGAPNKRVAKDVIVERAKVTPTGVTLDIESSTKHMQLTKSGFHAIWPHVFVNKHFAIRIRFMLRHALRKEFPMFATDTTILDDSDDDFTVQQRIRFDKWDDVLDLTIYKANGLRILGSSKAVRCKTCRKAGGSGCLDCGHKGRNTAFIDQGRPYAPVAVLNHKAELVHDTLHHLLHNPYDALKMTTVRCITGETCTEPFTKPSWAIEDGEVQTELDAAIGVSRKRTRTPGYRAGNLEDMGQTASWGDVGEIRQLTFNKKSMSFEVVSMDDPRVRILEQFLNDTVQHGNTDLTLAKVLITTDPSTPRIVAVPHRKFCINVGREHNGQDVYYFFNGKTIVQRCWSDKDGVDRKHGPCTGTAANEFFRSKKVTVPQHKIRAMFPGAITYKNPRKVNDLNFDKVPAMANTNANALLAHATVHGNRAASVTPAMIAAFERAGPLRRHCANLLNQKTVKFSYGMTPEELDSYESSRYDEEEELVFERALVDHDEDVSIFA